MQQFETIGFYYKSYLKPISHGHLNPLGTIKIPQEKTNQKVVLALHFNCKLIKIHQSKLYHTINRIFA
jgi:ABC-type metal ion transport system substrate-binding protein